MERLRQPKLIPLFAQDLLLSEDVQNWDGKRRLNNTERGNQILPLSVAAAETIRYQLLSNTVFPASVRQWAETNRVTLGKELDSRTLYRQFWDENREHFESENYGAVRPPGYVEPTRAPRQPGVPAIALQPKGRVPQTAKDATPFPSHDHDPTPPASTGHPAPPPANPINPLPFILLALLTGGTAWYWLRRR